MTSNKFLKPILDLRNEVESILDEKNIAKIHDNIKIKLSKVQKDIQLNMSQDFKPLKNKIQKQKNDVDKMIKNLIHDEINKAQKFLEAKKAELKRMQLSIESYIHKELKTAKSKSSTTKGKRKTRRTVKAGVRKKVVRKKSRA